MSDQSVPPAACAAAEHRQFDFWIGLWEVRLRSNGKVLGRNRVELVHGGCAILESWTGASGLMGNSLSWYEPADGLWHQLWRDSSGLTLTLVGGFSRGRMRMFAVTRDAQSQPIYNRITWSRVESGEVRHLWETSEDWGESWKQDYDLLYRSA